jgi:hypothetical protein
MCFAVVLVALTVQAQMSNKMSGGEKAISNPEQHWMAAGKTGNWDAVAPLLTANLARLESDSTTHNKSQAPAMIEGSKWESNDICDVKVSPLANTAIASAAWRGNGISANENLKWWGDPMILDAVPQVTLGAVQQQKRNKVCSCTSRPKYPKKKISQCSFRCP